MQKQKEIQIDTPKLGLFLQKCLQIALRQVFGLITDCKAVFRWNIKIQLPLLQGVFQADYPS